MSLIEVAQRANGEESSLKYIGGHNLDKYTESDKDTRPDKVTVKDAVCFVINQKLNEDSADNENRFIAFPTKGNRASLKRKLKKLMPTTEEQTVWDSLWNLSEAQRRTVWIEYTWASLAKRANANVFDVRQALKKFATHGLVEFQ